MYYFQELFKAKLDFPQRGVFARIFRLQLSIEKNCKCLKSARAGGWAHLELNE